jgi:hypothetical protein
MLVLATNTKTSQQIIMAQPKGNTPVGLVGETLTNAPVRATIRAAET